MVSGIDREKRGIRLMQPGDCVKEAACFPNYRRLNFNTSSHPKFCMVSTKVLWLGDFMANKVVVELHIFSCLQARLSAWGLGVPAKPKP